MNSITNPKTSLCSVSAWIAPGHGFVDFNCGEAMKATVGFYPSEGQYVDAQQDLNEAINRQFLDMQAHPHPVLKSTNKAVPNQKYLSSAQLSSRKSAYNSPVRYAKTSGTTLPCHLTPPFLIPGPSSLSAGISMSQATGIGLVFHSFLKGLSYEESVAAQLRDDSHVFKACLDRKIPCLVRHLNVTSDIAAKAWQELNAIGAGIHFNRNKQCSAKPLDIPLERTKYKVIGGNCIDFVRRIMDSTGVSSWKQNMQYSSAPTWREKIFSIAWQYFKWT